MPVEMDLLDENGAELEEAPLFCPVGRALDLIGERWTLVLMRHLLGGPRGFQELRHRTGITPRVLSTRLRQLAERGFVETVKVGSRSLYGVTELGRSLEPVVREISRWWVLNVMERTGPFSEASATSVVESLPFMLREERARGVHITYELRLTGKGGGVWTVDIDDGVCRVDEGFAERADVRYTADAKDWCLLALGVTDDREAFQSGRLTKDGAGGSIAWYFYQPAPLKGRARGDTPLERRARGDTPPERRARGDTPLERRARGDTPPERPARGDGS